MREDSSATLPLLDPELHGLGTTASPPLLVDPEHELNADVDDYVNVAAPSESETRGSTVVGAVFNFTNCIVGAGAIGLGGAISESGGLISIVAIVIFAILVKCSLDLTIALGESSYEELGSKAFGPAGKLIVMASKFAYSFGCLVAYTVVVRDNFGPAVINLFYSTPSESLAYWILNHQIWCTWSVSSLVILPLCMLRDMTPLASASVVSIMSMLSIVVIVVYLWYIDVGNMPHSRVLLSEATTATTEHTHSTFYEHWLEIRWGGFLANMGTFVFTFVCQHTSHLAFGSLKPELRTLQTWKTVSAASIAASCSVSLVVGVFVYATFWENTESDIFAIYPASTIIDLAKLLLCITMLLTFPLPFFSCRELIVVFFFPFASQRERSISDHIEHAAAQGDLEEPLLPQEEQEVAVDVDFAARDVATAATEDVAENETSQSALLPNENPTLRWAESFESSMSVDMSVLSTLAIDTMNSALLPGEERQLKLPMHLLFTGKIWFVATGLAIAAPNLGDVLDLIGCVSGTLIAFILPGCFAFRLQGYSHLAALILVVGGVVGTVGTIFSVKQMAEDALP